MTRRETGSAPRPLVDRPGVKPDMFVAMVGVVDVSVVSASDRLSGLKSVHRLPDRPGRR